MDFEALIESFGSASQIPHAVLYDYIVRDDVWRSLLNQRNLGSDKIAETPLGREVIRRTKSDLFWTARYFTWHTNPEWHHRGIEDNRIIERVHKPVCDLFVKKDCTKSIAEQDWRKERLLLYPRGAMKALDVQTVLPTRDGYKKMIEIEVGDFVFSPSGNLTKVLAVSPVYENRPCYEVVFSTGEKIVADEGHLWITDTRRDRDAARNGSLKQKATPKPSIKTTKQIADTLFCRKERNHRVSVCSPIKGEEQKFIIPPYVLGCWLGDGTSDSGSITGIDLPIIDAIREDGQVIRKSKSAKQRWALNGGPEHEDFRKHGSSFAGRLRKLGVFDNKHVPIEYMRGSLDQRRLLLQGLLDTDGCISETGKIRFDNKNRLLVEQAKELAASLGLKPGKISSHYAVLNGKRVGPYHAVCLTAYDTCPVFRLPRKSDRQSKRKATSLQDYRTIVSVTPVASRPVRCISVDDQTSMYLVGHSFIPTHNSTIDVVDAVQWVLAFPEIRILFLTAADDLAVGFVDEVKGHFIIRDDEPTFMNLFFPSYCITEAQLGAADQFTCPLWAARQVLRKEPTVLASSITSTLSGKHFDVIKADDCVSNRNSENEEQCKKVTKNFNINNKMLMPYGFIDLAGTRYADLDMYGTMLERNVGDVKIELGPAGFPNPLWEKIDNLTSGLQIYIGRGIVIKPEVVEKLKREGKPLTYKEAGEDGCLLLFPEHQPFNWLMTEFDKDERAFEGQINQNPHIQHDEVFPLELLLKSTVNHTEMPISGPCSQFWDFAFSVKKGRDYCTASNIIWNEKAHAYVNDLVRAKFSPDGLAQAVVDFAIKWRPYVIGIENAGGSQFLEDAIIRKARESKIPEVVAVCSRIDWVKVDTQEDAKRTRMRAVQPWLINDMMKFANYIPFKKELYSEFQRCMSSRRVHNDIPDCIAQQLRYAPRSQALIERLGSDIVTWSLDDISYNIMYGQWLSDSDTGSDAFGRIGAGMPQSVLLPQPVEEDSVMAENPYGGDNILGVGLFG